VLGALPTVDGDGYAWIPSLTQSHGDFAGQSLPDAERDKVRTDGALTERALRRVPVWRRHGCWNRQSTSQILAGCLSIAAKSNNPPGPLVEACIENGIDPAAFAVNTNDVRNLRYVFDTPAQSWTFVGPDGVASTLPYFFGTSIAEAVVAELHRRGQELPVAKAMWPRFVTVIADSALCEDPQAGPFFGRWLQNPDAKLFGTTLLMPGDTVHLTLRRPRSPH